MWPGEEGGVVLGGGSCDYILCGAYILQVCSYQWLLFFGPRAYYVSVHLWGAESILESNHLLEKC